MQEKVAQKSRNAWKLTIIPINIVELSSKQNCP